MGTPLDSTNAMYHAVSTVYKLPARQSRWAAGCLDKDLGSGEEGAGHRGGGGAPGGALPGRAVPPPA